MRKYILFNPLSGDEQGKSEAKRLDALYIGHELIYCDLTRINDYNEFFSKLAEDDEVIVCGGDGTLTCFVNAINDIDVKNNILYYATGSGNDFLRDLNKPNGSEPFRINHYIRNLPTAYVDDKSYAFINGVGYGLDGYVCETGNKTRKNKKKKINYTKIAIKAVLFSFKPKNATITVDGVERHYSKVWLSPVMIGKFLGGGMMVAPGRSREQDDLSIVVVHNCTRLRLLTILPTVFKGNHIKFRKNIEIIEGKEITVKYDTPCTLQIDGETFPDISGFSAVSRMKVPTEAL